MGKSRNNKEQDIFKRGNNNSELSNLKGLISPYGDDDDEEILMTIAMISQCRLLVGVAVLRCVSVLPD